jgi:hypothetical protein
VLALALAHKAARAAQAIPNRSLTLALDSRVNHFVLALDVGGGPVFAPLLVLGRAQAFVKQNHQINDQQNGRYAQNNDRDQLEQSRSVD